MLKQIVAQTICVRYTNERVDQNFEQAKNLITAYLKTIVVCRELKFYSYIYITNLMVIFLFRKNVLSLQRLIKQLAQKIKKKIVYL